MVSSKLYPKFAEGLPDVSGKVFVITGTTSGTGFIAARTVASKGGTVLLLNRKSQRSTDSLEKLKEAVPDGKFEPIECDLQDFSSVRNAIKEVKQKYKKIYCLANNAGIMATPDKATVDGYDTQMQTNHLSHFLMTAELFPLLEKEANESGDARIVHHSSYGRLHTVNSGLEKKYFEKNGGNLGGDSVSMMGGACFHRYFQTKLANSVFTYALDDKLKAKGSKIRAVAAHPGSSATDLMSGMNMRWYQRMIAAIVMPFMVQSPEDGTMGLLTGMMVSDAESGVLYGPKNNGHHGPAVPIARETYEEDKEAWKMLWTTSEEATGVKFDI